MDVLPLKPGYKSSELYLTITTAAVGLLVTAGYLTPEQADSLVKAIVAVTGGLMVIVSTGLYIYGRVKLKVLATKLSTATPQLPNTNTGAAAKNPSVSLG